VTFTTDTLSRCAGNNHVAVDVTIGATTRTLRFTLSELQGEPPDTLEEARREILDRLRSAAKEANATTWAQLQAALNNKTFKV